MLAATFSEIVLKGKNRGAFQRRLVENIEKTTGIKPRIVESWAVIEESNGERREEVRERLKDVLGIDYVYEIEELPLELEKVIERLERERYEGAVKIEVKRSNKKFPLNSLEIAQKIGKRLKEKGVKIDLKKPAKKIFVQVMKDKIYLSLNREKGWGGLPVGSSGRILSLLSGGIDSPVASWMMMRRGCAVDFLHVFEQEGDKIERIIKILKRYHPLTITLYKAPYSEFYKHTFSMDARYELVVFRRFILKLASRLPYKAVVTGDSLGQVASQTLENLAVTDQASEKVVFRPLIGMNKKDIIELSKKLGLYETSIEPYKDCCSLVAHKRPITKAKIEKVKEIEEEIGVEKIVERTLKRIKKIKI